MMAFPVDINNNNNNNNHHDHHHGHYQGPQRRQAAASTTTVITDHFFPRWDFADLNEEGLFCLDRREYDRAVVLFRHGLNRLNSQRHMAAAAALEQNPTARNAALPLIPHQVRPDEHPQDNDNDNNDDNDDDDEALDGWFYHAMPLPLELLEPEFVLESTVDPTGQFQLYDTAFLINYDNVVEGYAFGVTTLLYNMALSLHISALEQPNAVKLHQALQVYEKALLHIGKCRPQILPATRQGQRRVLLVALINNYGHVSALQCHQAGVIKAQTMLWQCLQDPWTIQQALNATEYESFKSSCLVGILREMGGTIVTPAA